jgi:hypothetical protein
MHYLSADPPRPRIRRSDHGETLAAWRRHHPVNAHSRQAKQITWGGVGGRQTADLAELADWVEGLRAAAHIARDEGKITLAEALDMTRFEVYEGYLDEELAYQQSQAAARRSR